MQLIREGERGAVVVVVVVLVLVAEHGRQWADEALEAEVGESRHLAQEVALTEAQQVFGTRVRGL